LNRRDRVWLFDLDNTLHNASVASFPGIDRGMTDYIERELALSRDEAGALRAHYLHRYGATLLGLVRHHGVRADHFLHHTHVLPDLERQAHGHPHDFDALDRLPGRKYILTNAPRAYAERVLQALGAAHHFDGVLCIEDMTMFGARSAQAVASAPRSRASARVCVCQILQTLADLPEDAGAARRRAHHHSGAALAARLSVSEAALYRHFASKAQMFEGLIEFIESSVFTLVNQITEREPSGALAGPAASSPMLLQFGEKNPAWCG
jgi:pyrimidine 5'-nucleotidase